MNLACMTLVLPGNTSDSRNSSFLIENLPCWVDALFQIGVCIYQKREVGHVS